MDCTTRDSKGRLYDLSELALDHSNWQIIDIRNNDTYELVLDEFPKLRYVLTRVVQILYQSLS